MNALQELVSKLDACARNLAAVASRLKSAVVAVEVTAQPGQAADAGNTWLRHVVMSDPFAFWQNVATNFEINWLYWCVMAAWFGALILAGKVALKAWWPRRPRWLGGRAL